MWTIKYILVVTVMLLGVALFAQSPEKMSYQAVVRGADAALVVDATIGMKISIVQGAADGTVVYTETQTPMTNANGLVSIMIGADATFADINWSMGPFFIKTEVDVTGGSTYSVVGTSELLSVPYALDANTTAGYSSMTYEEIEAYNPKMGDVVFNSTDSVLQVFDGENWARPYGECWPLPDAADAGESLSSDDGTTSFLIIANEPAEGHGVGEWVVIKGEGGTFSDASSFVAEFTGVLGVYYQLGWTITTSCDADTSILSVNIIDPSDVETDLDGNQYSTVVIGDQRWFTTNLKVSKLPDGSDIPQVQDVDAWRALTEDDTPASMAYYDNEDGDDYGYLYTYAAATGGDPSGDEVQGACPDGWRVPSTKDWKTMIEYVGAENGDDVKSQVLRASSFASGTDVYGLSILPVGFRYNAVQTNGEDMHNRGVDGYYLTSTTVKDNVSKLEAINFRAWHDGFPANDYPGSFDKGYGLPVRCMRDEL